MSDTMTGFWCHNSARQLGSQNQRALAGETIPFQFPPTLGATIPGGNTVVLVVAASASTPAIFQVTCTIDGNGVISGSISGTLTQQFGGTGYYQIWDSTALEMLAFGDLEFDPNPLYMTNGIPAGWIAAVTINGSNHLIFTTSANVVIDAGELPSGEQADWNAPTTAAPGIANRPTLGTAAAHDTGFFDLAGAAAAVAASLSSYVLAVTTVAGHALTGSITIAAADLSNGTTGTGAVALAASPAFTGAPTAPTPSTTESSAILATTSFVQAVLASALQTTLKLKGDLDCSANPNYPAGVVGDEYRVSVAGKVGGASGISVDVSDTVICKTNNAGGTQASVGTSWFTLEHNFVGALVTSNALSELAGAAAAARSNIGAAASALTITINGTTQDLSANRTFTIGDVTESADGLMIAADKLYLNKIANIPNFVNPAQYFNGTIYYVSTTGNDSNAGTSPSLPFLTLSHAASVATVAGTLVCVGAGTFALGSGTLVWSPGVSVSGAGIDITTITSTADGTSSAVIIYRPGSNSIHQDMTIQGVAASGIYQMPFGLASDIPSFVNVVARRLKLVGDSDGFYLATGTFQSYVSLITIDCIVQTKYDGLTAFNNSGAAYIVTEHHNLTITVTGPSSLNSGNTARAFSTSAGNHFIYGGQMLVTGSVNGSGIALGVQSSFGVIALFGTVASVTATGAGTSFDLKGNNPGRVVIVGSATYTTSTGKIDTFTGSNTGDQTSVTGNAGTATKWAAARTFTLAGVLSGMVSFDGSADPTLTAAIQATNAQSGTSYALVLSDAFKLVTLSNAAAITLTVPANSTAAFVLDTEIKLAQLGAGSVTISAASGVTIESATSLTLSGQYASATLKKLATNTWLVTTSPLPAAVKSDQTTATSNTVAVTPGVQQFHPSAAKAWVKFDGKTGGTATIKSSYNVASVVRTGTGLYTVTFTTPFSSADYVISGIGVDPGNHIGLIYLNGTIAAGSIAFGLWDISNVTFFDAPIVALSFFGTE